MSYTLTRPLGGTVTVESKGRADVFVSRGYELVTPKAKPSKAKAEPVTDETPAPASD